MANPQGLASWENQAVIALRQVTPALPHQLPEEALRTVSGHRCSQALADHDADPAVPMGGACTASDEVEQRGLNPATGPFDALDLGAVPQEESTISRRPGHGNVTPSHGEPDPPLGPSAGQDFAAVLGAHPLPESVISFSFQIRGLLERERHRSSLVSASKPGKRGHYRCLSWNVSITPPGLSGTIAATTAMDAMCRWGGFAAGRPNRPIARRDAAHADGQPHA